MKTLDYRVGDRVRLTNLAAFGEKFILARIGKDGVVTSNRGGYVDVTMDEDSVSFLLEANEVTLLSRPEPTVADYIEDFLEEFVNNDETCEQGAERLAEILHANALTVES